MCDAMDADEVEALLKEQDAKGTKGISRNAKGKKGTLQNAKGKKGISRNAKKNTITSQKRKKGKSETTGTKCNTCMKTTPEECSPPPPPPRPPPPLPSPATTPTTTNTTTIRRQLSHLGSGVLSPHSRRSLKTIAMPLMMSLDEHQGTFLQLLLEDEGTPLDASAHGEIEEQDPWTQQLKERLKREIENEAGAGWMHPWTQQLKERLKEGFKGDKVKDEGKGEGALSTDLTTPPRDKGKAEGAL